MALIPAVVIARARGAYLSLPLTQGTKLRIVDAVYRLFGPFFRETPHYESWKRSQHPPLLQNLQFERREVAAILETLAFETVERPLVSIVIPAYGKLDITARCLARIQATISQGRSEVIVVEDASGDTDVLRLAAVPGLRFLVNETNLGFVGSCNRGAAAARGHWLVFLNNDTEPQAGWLEALQRTFEEFPLAGIVGARLVYPSGRLQESGAILWRDGSAWNYGRQHTFTSSAYSFVRRTDYVSGAALMIESALFGRVGGFSPEFSPGYYEDTDLAFKVRDAGRDVLVQPFSVVIHKEGASAGTDLAGGMKAFQMRNKQVFLRRWTSHLSRQFPYASQLRLACERLTARRVVLIVDQYVPHPDRDAGSRSVSDIVDALLRQGWIVKFWPHTLWYEEHYTTDLQRRGVEVFYGKEHANQFPKIVAELAPALHGVLLNRPRIAEEYLGDIRRFTSARVVFYGHDIHHLRLSRQEAVESPSTHRSASIEKTRKLEESLWKKSDVVLYPSDSEVDEVARVRPDAKVLQVPLYAYDEFETPRALTDRGSRDLLFVAGFGHPPNVDGVVWFANKVFPLVQAKIADARLLVVGSAPTRVVTELAGTAIQVLGAVDAITLVEQYRNARVAVVPVRYGAGVKGKVVEALCYGLPLVTTTTGAQGIGGIAEVCDVVDEPEAMGNAIVALMTDDLLWQRRSAAGQALGKAQFARQRLDDVLRQAFGTPLD